MIVFESIFPFADIIDIPINIAVTAGLLIFAYWKSKNVALSGYYAIFTSVTTMISGSIVGVLVAITLNVYYGDVRSSLALYFVGLIPTFILCYVLSKYIGNHLHQYYAQLSHEIKRKFAFYGLILSGFTFLLSHVNIFVYRVVADRGLISNINLILITCIFFVVITMLSAYSLSNHKQMLAEFKIQSQEDLTVYTQNLEAFCKEMRSFRHDHYNLLNPLLGYENMPELKSKLADYLSYASEEMENIDNFMLSLNNIGIPELKGLLAVKLASAHTKKIKVELDIPKHINHIPIYPLDLCRIVGIALDNAIEELQTHEYEHKFLKFAIVEDPDIMIICSNPCKNPPVTEEVFNEGYSTKASSRGIGLANIKKICDEVGNVLYTVNTENEQFTLILMIRQV
jgi:two-component system sensor histidine kinase AgrC